MKRKYTRWTPEKVAELKRLHGQGLSLREVSARMGLPRYAAECRYSRLPREEKSPYLSESAHDLKRHLEVEERAHAKHRIRFMPIEEEPTLDGLYPAVAEELRRQRDGIPVVDHSVPDEPIEMRIEAEGCDVHLDFAVSARVTPDGDGRETPRVTVYQDVQVRWKSPLRVTYWDAEGDETDYDNADELAKLRKFVEEEIQAIIEWE